MDPEVKPLRILVLTRSTHFHQNGIFENHVKTLYEGLEKKGHFITILTTAHPSGIKIIKAKRIKWIFLEQTPKGIYSKPWAKRSAAYYSTYLKDERFDLVHCQSLSGFEFLKKHYPLTCPVITTRHNTFYHDFVTHCLRAKQLPFLKRWSAYSRYYIDFRRKYSHWEKPCFENSDYHIAISNHQKEVYKNIYKIKKERSFVVPNSISPPVINTVNKFIHPKNIEKKHLFSSHLKDSDSKFIYSFIVLIIKLLNSFPHLHFVFTGSKKSLTKLKKQCERKLISSQCLFIEKQSFDDIYTIHNECRYYLSLSRDISGYDRLQLSLMQNGHIIILNQNKVPSSLIIHRENGLILPLKNSSLTANSIIELIHNDSKQKFFLAQSKLTIKNLLSTEKMIEDIENVFYDIKVKNEKT